MGFLHYTLPTKSQFEEPFFDCRGEGFSFVSHGTVRYEINTIYG